MQRWLADLADTGKAAVLILDSCHSANMSRGAGPACEEEARSRCSLPPGKAPPELSEDEEAFLNSLTYEKLFPEKQPSEAAERYEQDEAAFGMRDPNGKKSSNFMLIAGARAEETAKETAKDGGVFTSNIVGLLEEMLDQDGERKSYAALRDKFDESFYGKGVHEKFKQNPTFEGDLDL